MSGLLVTRHLLVTRQLHDGGDVAAKGLDTQHDDGEECRQQHAKHRVDVHQKCSARSSAYSR